ncbi:MAG TPA: glucans biosynthesis glucosyltransferase MdoH [Candidatus Binatia bacterium]|nr:glucans biosynthesis glucosyltransferase MdoH [Candidatus Binatia bacterium]
MSLRRILDAAEDFPSGPDRGGIAMPRIARVSMAPRPLERNPLRVAWKKLRISRRAAGLDRGSSAKRLAPWHRVAIRRRTLLALLVIAQTIVASWSLVQTFPSPDFDYLQIVIVTTFVILFGWISFSFWSTIAGFWMLLRNRKMTYGPAEVREDRPLRGRTAIVMPICDEDVRRCFAGIEVMYRSLRKTGQGHKFTFFVLSDTGTPGRQIEEETAWAETCRAVNGFGRIYYRRRRVNIKRKSGNIADFLRRWSRNYDYMIVLDADSLMTGAAMLSLARMMEASPQVGIIQSTPTIVNGHSLFARMQQFASRAYGPLFSASLHFWQLGESYYWGHNAIIRIESFIKHCGLARLPGRPPLGGEILSHDFVEAALMGRAGLEVWLAPDLPGSYEESPPTLLDELKRDRRWCQGNLQHLRILFAEGIKSGHRAILAMGVMAYVSAFFWAGFLILNTIHVAYQSLVTPAYFSSQPSLFPIWPQWRPEWAIALASTTALLLFLPKLFSYLLILKKGEAKRFGGIATLGISIICEIILSTFLAPLRMWFHCKFVLLTLIGRPIKWTTQQRSASGTAWEEATRAHRVATLIAWGSLAAISWFDAALSVWILPVAIPLFLSIPLSVFSGSVSLGRLAYLFRIPEEESPPSLLEELRTVLMDEQRQLQSAVDRLHFRVGDAFMRAPQKSHPIAKSVAHSP